MASSTPVSASSVFCRVIRVVARPLTQNPSRSAYHCRHEIRPSPASKTAAESTVDVGNAGGHPRRPQGVMRSSAIVGSTGRPARKPTNSVSSGTWKAAGCARRVEASAARPINGALASDLERDQTRSAPCPPTPIRSTSSTVLSAGSRKRAFSTMRIGCGSVRSPERPTN